MDAWIQVIFLSDILQQVTFNWLDMYMGRVELSKEIWFGVSNFVLSVVSFRTKVTKQHLLGSKYIYEVWFLPYNLIASCWPANCSYSGSVFSLLVVFCCYSYTVWYCYYYVTITLLHRLLVESYSYMCQCKVEMEHFPNVYYNLLCFNSSSSILPECWTDSITAGTITCVQIPFVN